jgi:cysteine desulfurase / selenocysteine lyase
MPMLFANSGDVNHPKPPELSVFDVACRTGLHCAPLVHESIGSAPQGAVRFSVGPTTTLADVEAGAHAIRALAAEIRG